MKKNNEVFISLKNIKKKYTSIREEDFYVLNNISLDIKKGDRIGILGQNGAGKTTLLKILSGITKPTEGTITQKGKIVSLLDLEAGFHPELTGYENILTNGLLVGMTRKEIISSIPSIIDFSGIKEFIHEPFFTYSSGMKFRLAFSIAMASECNILIIDEIFISGDIDFQIKSMKLIEKFRKKKNVILILSSHLPGFIFNFVDTYLSIHDGHITKLTKTDVFKKIEKTNRIWKKIYK